MSDEKLNPGVYKAWLASHPDLQGTDDYKQVEAAYMAAGGRSDELQAVIDVVKDKSTGQLERLAMLMPYVYYKGKDMAVSAGVRGGPAMLGQMAGQRLGGNLGARAGAGAGALVGSIADQVRLRGPTGVKTGETLADVTGAVLNPRGVLRSAATTAGLEAAQQLVDEGGVDLRRVAGASAIAGAGAKLANALEAPLAKTIKPEDAKYAYRYRAFEDVKPYGVAINPADIERGSEMFNQLAGTSAMTVAAARKNQDAWQKMAREQAGLEIDPKKLKMNSLAFEPTTKRFGFDAEKGEIDRAIKDASAPYEELKQISRDVNEESKLFAEQNLKNGKYVTSYTTPEGLDSMRSAESALREIQATRRAMKEEFGKLADGDPNARLRIEALKQSESQLESRIEAAATAASIVNPAHKDLVNRLKQAREKIAILKAVDNATDTNGLVSPRMLSLQRDSGVPLTNNLEKVALFYNAFRGEAQTAIDAGVAASGAAPNYTARNIAMGNKAGFFSGGIPVAGAAARNVILSDRMQNRFVNPRLSQVSDPAGTLVRQSSMLGGMAAGTPDEPLPAMTPSEMQPQPSLRLLEMVRSGNY